MKRLASIPLVVFLLMLVSTNAGSAQSGPVLNPANGHYYELVPADSIDWPQARDAAAARTYQGCSGHLATITSAEEESFVVNNFGYDGMETWIGGLQAPSVTPPDAGWQWVTGEPFVYTDWCDGEPNDWLGTASEQYLTYWNEICWNDAFEASSGFIVEYTCKTETAPPTIDCAAADGQWHAGDVSIACTASDSGSGLANPADASFSLSTSVPAGTETANAATGAHIVCDVAENCATAGPIGGNKVDKLGPSISISVPAPIRYRPKQAVAASYTCSDGGSNVGTCIGTVDNGGNINTWPAGVKTFTVNAGDRVGNTVSQSVEYKVGYPLYLPSILRQ